MYTHIGKAIVCLSMIVVVIVIGSIISKVTGWDMGYGQGWASCIIFTIFYERKKND